MFKRPEDVITQEEIFQLTAQAANHILSESKVVSSVLVIAYHWNDASANADGKPHKIATVYERMAKPCGCNAKTPQEKQECLLRRVEGHVETMVMYADDIEQNETPLSH